MNTRHPVLPDPLPRRLSVNERSVLSLINGAKDGIAGAEIARQTGLSAQTASVITRSLESAQLIAKGPPQKGKVGKPISPLTLNPEGAFSMGLRIGRRGADMILMDLVGTVRGRRRLSYAYPVPSKVEAFAKDATQALEAELPAALRQRIVGIGIAAPYEMWNWLDIVDAPKEDMARWRDITFEEMFAKFTDLPVSVANDASIACSGELFFGKKRPEDSFAYFYVGTFIGGGLVLNGCLFFGSNGNAAAFGSVPVTGSDGQSQQLLTDASIYALERQCETVAGGPVYLWGRDAEWDSHPEIVTAWIRRTAAQIAQAAVAVTAVVSTHTVIVDGGFPEAIRAKLTAEISRAIGGMNTQGIQTPIVQEGSLGRDASTKGAAYQPILMNFMAEGLSAMRS